MNHDAISVQMCRDAGMDDETIDIVLTRAKGQSAAQIAGLNRIIGNDSKELRRLCAARDAARKVSAEAAEAVKSLRAENERLREALRWTAATLQHAVYGQRRIYASDKITIIAADGETRAVEQILDAADAALAQEQS